MAVNSSLNICFMKKLMILSGAGLSAESGIATFRDKDGLWEKHRVEEICNLSTWQENYDLVHRFYNGRRVQLGTVQPNAAHQMIASWESRYNAVIITQNVDDLLERAGCKQVTHVHGHLTEMHCTACNHRWKIGYTEWTSESRCQKAECGARDRVKPNVVFFGESAPLYRTMFEEIDALEEGDVFLVIGTMGSVLPVDLMARQLPCTRVLNNLEANDMIDDRNFDHVFYEPATQAIRKLDVLLQKLMG